MIKYYLAAAFSRRIEMRERAGELLLNVSNSDVTSRWFHDGKWEQDFPPDMLNSRPEDCVDIAESDLDDIQRSDVLILFTGAGRGGRHVEFGYALALGKRLVVIGAREILFHALPNVEVYQTWEEFLAHDAAA